MNDQKHIVVINGRRYNAQTGEKLSHPETAATAIAHHAHEPAAPAHKPAHVKAAREPAKHVAAHAPKRTQTLMRQSVHKPTPSLKRKIRVQGHLDSHVKLVQEAPSHPPIVRNTRAHHHTPGGRIIISHFSPDLFTTVKHVQIAPPDPKPETPAIPEPAPKHTAKSTYNAAHRKPLTTAELLEYVVQSANMPAEEDHPAHARHKPHRKLLKRHSHAAAAR